MEAIAHLRQGLALLETLPETPQRLQRQVDMLIALGASFIATQGYAASDPQDVEVTAEVYYAGHYGSRGDAEHAEFG